jgi:LexA-binding, inner membrane-associated putative hydrolase
VDPLSHLLFGRVLIAADRSGRLGGGAVAACVLGAVAPDLDAVLMPAGWDVYLRAHEVGTHSILGSLGCAVVVAGGVAGVSRSGRAGRTMEFDERAARVPGMVRLLIAAASGSLSHLYWDLASGATIRVGWPIVDERISAPLVAMGDPLAAVPIVAGGVAVLAWRRHRAAIVAVTLAALAVLLCFKLVVRDRALEAYTASAAGSGVSPDVVQVEARWGSPFDWHVYDRAGARLRHWDVDGWNRRSTLVLSLDIEPASEAVLRSTALDTVRNFRRAHDLTFAAVAPASRGVEVLWSDIRFCSPSSSGSLTRDGVSCDLWFGGTFDASGMPVAQVVWLGGHRFERPPPTHP